MIQQYAEIAPQPAMCEATNGGDTMIVEHQGRVISDHEPGGEADDAAAIINPEALSQYRHRSLWAGHDPLTTDQIETLQERGIWPGPALGVEQSV